jgi:hypothetical protein
MRMIFDLVEPAVLTNYVRQYDNEVLKNQLGLEQFLPNTPNPELEYRVTKNAFLDVDVAEYRPFDVQPTMTGRQGFERIRGELVPLGRQIPLTEEDHHRLRNLGNAQGAAAPGLIADIFADAERMTRAVQMRIEVARGQVLTTGKFTLAENNLFMEADFGVYSGHAPTTGTAWSNVAATILADLLTWQQLYVDDTGIEPGVILTSRKVLGYMFLNTQMREAAGFGGTTPSRLNVEMVDAIFAANGLPPVMLYDTKARINGVSTRIIPEDKVLFLPAPGSGESLGATHYGITAEAMFLAEEGQIEAEDAPGVVAVNYKNDAPVQTFTAAHAIAVPVMPNTQLVICADVIP